MPLRAARVRSAIWAEASLPNRLWNLVTPSAERAMVRARLCADLNLTRQNLARMASATSSGLRSIKASPQMRSKYVASLR